jgi:hypothetical protein
MDMQQQLQQQTRNLFGSFPFPNFAAPSAKPPQEPDRNPQDPGKGGGEDKR